MSPSPRVAICIPTYNGAAYIRAALTSAIAQDYDNFAIIISDDHSTDHTLAIVQEIERSQQAQFSRSRLPSDARPTIKILKHPRLGLVGNWNHCVNHCLETGLETSLETDKFKYIKFLFQDDLLANNCLSQMVAAAEQDDRIGMVFSRRRLLLSDAGSARSDLLTNPSVTDSSANKLVNSTQPANYQPELIESDPNAPDNAPEPLPASLQWLQNLHQHWSNLQPIQPGLDLLSDRNLCRQPDNKIGEPTNVLISTAVFKQIGLFDLAIHQFCDLEMWWRIMAHFRVAFVDQPLATFRLHPQQTTNSNLAADRIWDEIYAVWLKLICADVYAPIPQPVRDRILRHLITSLMREYPRSIVRRQWERLPRINSLLTQALSVKLHL
ncbi:glycosyl transferase family 2 [Thalassoporum mexicanum PCC 7367]|uniref:glycosyltransferase n=1 Tax=Thalassoporum mexicanum TaxID=3457544 RepID=UPI00029FB675|nr:glycosyltransferase [Pseudanabaena sp. PCC 7367]AFY70179.1 glycosyl transferase family 2 [Pseudanabaena sp. PCC 7367]